MIYEWFLVSGLREKDLEKKNWNKSAKWHCGRHTTIKKT